MAGWFVVPMAALAIGFCRFVRRSIKRRELRALRQRESLGDSEIYQRFYATSKLSEAEVTKLWHEIATTPAFQLTNCGPMIGSEPI